VCTGAVLMGEVVYHCTRTACCLASSLSNALRPGNVSRLPIDLSVTGFQRSGPFRCERWSLSSAFHCEGAREIPRGNARVDEAEGNARRRGRQQES
jgi:hypothetical protein